MKGIPRHLNSKFDYIHLRDNHPPEIWAPEWRRLLEGRFLQRGVIDREDGPPSAAVLPEPVEDPNARIFRLGFTPEEVADALSTVSGMS